MKTFPRNLPTLCDALPTLLLGGGDTRLALLPETGFNRTGCSPVPAPNTLSYGSSTASTISERAYRHLETERQRLSESSRFVEPKLLLDRETERQREELKSLFSLDPKTEIIFSPSGTDATLHALFVTQTRFENEPLDCLLVASDETGSGVPYALAGKHFNSVTAAGVAVSSGEPIASLGENVTLIPFPLRDSQGVPHSHETLENRIFEWVSGSVQSGRRVLLQTIAGSKFGATFPGSEFLATLENRFPDDLQIVVDACQLRLDPAELTAHLTQGRLVLISGSKFFTGPPFSGALLVPETLAKTLKKTNEIPAGLRDYADRISFPTEWKSLRENLPDRANFGAWFRWEAALVEMRAYFAVPQDFRQAALRQFEALAMELLTRRAPDFRLLEPAESSAISGGSPRTIFPFLVRGNGGDWLSPEALTSLYQNLNRNLTDCLPISLFSEERNLVSQRCLVGQPVALTHDGTRTGAIRLCASARTVTDLWDRTPELASLTLDRERQHIKTILDKTALISRLPLAALPALKRAA